jgi:hypothetical protein
MTKLKRRAANKLFQVRFPSYVHLRHGYAHNEEMRSTASDREEHEVEGPVKFGSDDEYVEFSGNMLFGEMMEGRIYRTSWEGKMVEYEISVATLKSLIEVRDAFYGAFSIHVASPPEQPRSPPEPQP